MKEKDRKQLYSACNKAILQHCKANNIKLKDVECTIKGDNLPVMVYTYKGKEIMIGKIVDEPKIKIKKYKP